MPLTRKGTVLLQKLTQEYGPAKAKHVLYGGENKGTFTGIHREHHSPPTPAEEARHKSLAKEVGGKLRTMRFGK